MNEYCAPTSSKINSTEIINKNKRKKEIEDNINNKLKEIFGKIFNCLDFYLSIIIDGLNLVVKIESFNEYEIDAYTITQQGTGIRNLLSLLLMLEKNKYDITSNFLYLIDELEDGLTINLQEKVVEYLCNLIKKNKNVTIIYTTHSPSLLPQIDKLDENANLIISYRREKSSEDRKELSGELLTIQAKMKNINETGIQFSGLNKVIDNTYKDTENNNTKLMKRCLDLNDEIARKLYNIENKIEDNN